MKVAGDMVVQVADVAVVQVAVGAVVEVAGRAVVQVAGGAVVEVAADAVVEVAAGAVVEVACGGAGGQPAEAAVPGQWARTAWVLSFFVLGNSLRRELKVPLGAYPLRGSTHALGEGSFAGTVSAERPSPRANSQ
jgi:hypothetical protein